MENTGEIRRFERRPFVWELVGKLLDEELTSRRKNFARNVEFLLYFSSTSLSAILLYKSYHLAKTNRCEKDVSVSSIQKSPSLPMRVG